MGGWVGSHVFNQDNQTGQNAGGGRSGQAEEDPMSGFIFDILDVKSGQTHGRTAEIGGAGQPEKSTEKIG